MGIPRIILAFRASHFAFASTLCCLGLTVMSFPTQSAEPRVIVPSRASSQAGGIPFSKTATRKVGADLLSLNAEYQAYQKQVRAQAAPALEFQSSNTLAPVSEEFVVVDFAASGDTSVLAADLRGLGAVNVTMYGRMVSARLPITAVPALDKLSSLQFARPAYAFTRVGDVTSQGDAALRADVARQSFGIDGTGAAVGTLSDSYNCLAGAAAGVASGDLPSEVVVLEEGPCPRSDEGRAMMEIIHDVAPGAAQIFHTASGGQANFAQGIIDLANAGAHVINDDVGYLDEPFFQDGIIAQAIDTVNDTGVAYFSSAGNSIRNSYESPFRPSGMFVDIGFGPQEAHDFDPGPGVDPCQAITIPIGSRLTLDFQWDQPYFSVSGPPGSASDMDIVIANQDCPDGIVGASANANVGGDPIEIAQFTNPGPTTTFNVIILSFSGPLPGLMKTVLFGGGQINEFSTFSSTSFGHSAPNQGLGVGAANYSSTPRFGVNPPLVENFSSAGGTPILFDIAGNRLVTPIIRAQPGITAPDGGDTTFFGNDSDGTGFPNFFGTSAAAPHAAGVAALIKSSDLSLTPIQIYAALQNTAIDMDDPSTPDFDTGFDFGTGFGLIDANAALGWAAPSLDISRGGWRAMLQ